MRTREKKGSLLWAIDKTKTAMGARLLRSWVQKPLIDVVQISNRQSAVECFFDNRDLCEEVGELLSTVLDIERLTAKSVYGSANAKDLKAISESIGVLPTIKSKILENSRGYLSDLCSGLDTLEDLYALLKSAICDDPPFSVREGGMIRDGFDRDVDYFRTVRDNGSSIMKSIEERERENTGIRTLKVD
jgi:DNA mismatch repair protein MutS